MIGRLQQISSPNSQPAVEVCYKVTIVLGKPLRKEGGRDARPSLSQRPWSSAVSSRQQSDGAARLLAQEQRIGMASHVPFWQNGIGPAGDAAAPAAEIDRRVPFGI